MIKNQGSQDDGQSGYGNELRQTITEEDSEYSQTIGSLVSYTINYMEKGTVRGGGGRSSHHDGERVGGVDHSDSDDDNSLLAEKEDSHSDIDTIEEEVDLSSEGSDHEDQQPEEDDKEAAKQAARNQQHKQVQQLPSSDSLNLVNQGSPSSPIVEVL